jgi:signal transduction histidine kinase
MSSSSGCRSDPTMKVAHDLASAPTSGDSGSTAFRLWHAAVREAACAYLVDRSGRLRFASRGFAELLGEEKGRLPPPLLDGLQRLLDHPYEGAETVELAGRRYRAARFPIFAEDGEVLGVAGILELAMVEAAPPPAAASAIQLAALEAAIEEAERRIGDLENASARASEESRRKTALLGTISHELRTPLNAIIGFSELVLRQIRGPLPDAYRGYIEDIAAAGRHMGELVETLLDVARLEAGELRIERRPVSARPLAAEARAIVAMRAEAEGVDLGQVALKGDWILDIDPLRGRQILVNLLTNAIKFTPAGGAVGLEVTRIAGGLIDITVWDNGVGIDPVHQGRVFEPFYQVPGSAARPGLAKGAGLGLAISRQIAHAMGGDILLASEPGKGSRFTVRLPLAAAEATAAIA